jgi:hypothetical protein
MEKAHGIELRACYTIRQLKVTLTGVTTVTLSSTAGSAVDHQQFAHLSFDLVVPTFQHIRVSDVMTLLRSESSV